MKKRKRTKAECGKMGGLTTASRYGSTYMASIGRRGAAAFWAKYQMVPVGTSYFALVNRDDGTFASTTLWKQ